MTGIPLPLPRLGITPAAGAKLFVYQAGTTTKVNTYTTSALSVANSNPLSADAAGLFGAVYIDPTLGALKIVLSPSTDTDPPASPTLTQDNLWLPSQVLPAVLSKSANYTVSTADGFDVLIEVDASGGAVTIAPYTAVGNAGKRICVKKIDSSANTVTIDPNGAQTIDGSTTKVLSTQYDSALLESDGANWMIVGLGRVPNLTAVLSKTTTYSVAVTDGDDVLILADATAGAMSINLYAVSGQSGKRVTVIKTDTSANAVTIDGSGAETINGLTTYVITGQYQSATVETNGTAWFIRSQTSKVLQIVAATYSTQVDSSSATYADTGLTANITPVSITSKILAIVHQAGVRKTGNTQVALKLLRGSTLVAQFETQAAFTNSTLENNTSAGCVALDAPASVAAQTYKTQFNSAAGVATGTVQSANCTSTMVLLEVAA